MNMTWEDLGEFLSKQKDKMVRAPLPFKTYTLFANYLSWKGNADGEWRFVKKNKFTSKGGEIQGLFLEDEDHLPYLASKEQITEVTEKRGKHPKEELNSAAKKRAENVAAGLQKAFGIVTELVPVSNKKSKALPLLLRPFDKPADGYMLIIKDEGDNFTKIKTFIKDQLENGTVYRKASFWNVWNRNYTYPKKNR